VGGGLASRRTGRLEDRTVGEPYEIPYRDLLAGAGPELLLGSPRSA